MKSNSCSRVRDAPKLSFEESERRALLLKEWSKYKYTQHQTEMHSIHEALEAQRRALDELKLESEELYKAAVSPDTDAFPFQHEGPTYTPPITHHEAPEGKYNDVTRVYTQWGVHETSVQRRTTWIIVKSCCKGILVNTCVSGIQKNKCFAIICGL